MTNGPKNTSDASFKKTTQEVNRPPVVDNLNDEAFRNPPHNVDANADSDLLGPANHFTEVPKADRDAEMMGGGVNGDVGKGRALHEGVEAQQVQDSTVHG